MQRVLVDQGRITEVTQDDVPSQPLEAGQVRLGIESFALTANNVTYAASGFAIGYWKFFPTGVEGKGLVPVWGVAKVIESALQDVAVGSRYYGFYPLADELVVMPEVSGRGNLTDVAPHRVDLPAVYNRYTPVGETTPDQDHLLYFDPTYRCLNTTEQTT